MYLTIFALLSRLLDLTCSLFVRTGFPFTVLSQLTTGPMLDSIAPEDKIGYVQGLNNASMNFGMAIGRCFYLVFL